MNLDLNKIENQITSIKSQVIYIDKKGKLKIIPNIISYGGSFGVRDQSVIALPYLKLIRKINEHLLVNEYFTHVISNNKNIIGLIKDNKTALIIKINFTNENKMVFIIKDNYNYNNITCFLNGFILIKNDGKLETYNIKGLHLNINIPKLENEEKFISVKCGKSHIVLLKNNNNVVAYGSNYYGQCDIPLIENNDIFYTQIGALEHSTVLLRNDGKCIIIGQQYMMSINNIYDNNNKYLLILQYNIFLIKNEKNILYNGISTNFSENYNRIKCEYSYFNLIKNKYRIINDNFEYIDRSLNGLQQCKLFINYITRHFNNSTKEKIILNIIKCNDDIYIYNLSGEKIINEEISLISIRYLYYLLYLNIDNYNSINGPIPILIYNDKIIKNNTLINKNYLNIIDIIEDINLYFD